MSLTELVRARRSRRSARVLHPETSPEKAPKFNGYIFKRDNRERGSSDGKQRYVPKVCRCMPLHPKTYGLACDLPQCQYCHPDPATPASTAPQNCMIGRRGCRPEKLIYVKPKKENPPGTEVEVPSATKTETRRRLQIERDAQAQQGKQGNCFRLSKWEESPMEWERIQEGHELASAGDVVLPADGGRADLDVWDAQIAFLARQGLLEDFEAQEAHVTLEGIRQMEPAYTVRFQPARKRRTSPRRQSDESWEMYDERDWDTDLFSLDTEDEALSWTMMEDSDEEGQPSH